MAVAGLRALAAAAPAAVFVARGVGAGLAPVELAARRDVRLVATPRHATVLLAAGRFPGELGGALARVHDQLPHPRGVVWWAPGGHRLPQVAVGGGGRGGDPGVVTVAAGDDPAAAVVALHRAVCRGSRPTRPDLGRDVPPHPFEGRGDHGQGGEGMMGGVPFGRPMAMTGEDRDGLSLDRSAVRMGPFLPGMPTALALDVVLQGGVVQEASPRPLVAGPVARLDRLDPVLACFERARHEPVPVADLERARARHLLRWVAEACRLGGLPALGARAAAAAGAVAEPSGPGETRHPPLASLARRLRRAGLPRAWSGVGVLGACPATSTGPSARAAGMPVDARQDDPAYRRLDFAVVTGRGGDAAARLTQRLAEADQAVGLAAAAARHGVVHDPADPLEPPQAVLGPVDPTATWDPAATWDAAGPTEALAGLGDGLRGMDWSDAVLTLWSLDLDLAGAATAAEVGR